MEINSHGPKMIALLKKLVETESPTRDKEAVDSVGAILAEESRNLGASIVIHPQENAGNHILAKWDAPLSHPDEKGILLLGHMDTVFPMGTLETMPFYEEDNKIFGPGVLDMKGGLVIALTAIARLRDTGKMPNRPVTMLFTSDEETGSVSSRALIERVAAESSLVFVLEPALLDGSLKTWRKGTGKYDLRTYGRAAHAGGAHAEGCNAIEEMAHQILAIQEMTDYEKGTTLNVGVISGGTESNVVPDFAKVDVDLRVMKSGEYERIDAAIQSLRPVLEGTSIIVEGELDRPPMPFDEMMEKTFTKAQSVAKKVGITLKAGGSGGASDANFIALLGIPILDGLGAVGEGLHSPREYILTESLSAKAGLLATLLLDW